MQLVGWILIGLYLFELHWFIFCAIFGSISCSCISNVGFALAYIPFQKSFFFLSLSLYNLRLI